MKNTFLYLLHPSWRAFWNRGRGQGAGGKLRNLFLLLLGAAFWAGIFYLFSRVLSYFQGVEGIGTVLAVKLLTMIMVVFFSLLVFSNIITALSAYYLSDELVLLHALPLPHDRIYLAKFLETLLSSSWMIVLFGMPVFGAYGVVYRASWVYYGAVVVGLFPLLVIAAAAGIICTMLLVRLFPARRTKEILVLLGIVFLVSLYLLFRFLQPERLFQEAELDRFIQFLVVVRTPSSVYLPSHWLTEFLVPLLFGRPGETWFHFMLLASTAMASVTIGEWVAGRLYMDGWMKSQEGRGSMLVASSRVDRAVDLLARPLGPQTRSVVRRDAVLFLRDSTQWTQLLLLAALMVVYLYNFRVLDLTRIPISTVYMQNLLSFLNMGLAGFVVSAVAIRFVFPAVSIEGKSFWIVRSAPITIRRLLWSKFWMYLVPLLLLSEVLIILSNRFLNVSGFMMGLSVVTMVLLTSGIVGLGIGLGAVYPRFFVENVAKIATGYGAILYMILAMGFIALAVFLEAWPVNAIFMSHFAGMRIAAHQWLLIAGSLTLVAVLSLGVCCLPMHWGIRRLETSEW
jgi:ABC-2 type transport system permease protein